MLVIALAIWPTLIYSWILPLPQWPLRTFQGGHRHGVKAVGNAHNRLGAVASENKQCSRIGIDILRTGGNAADALVGTVFCVGVVDCHHSGPGGGGIGLARSANGSYESIDFRETAPAAAYENMFKHNVLGSIFGGLSSGVPGEVRGLQYIHEHYGSLPWPMLLEPAIHLARNGFVISADFAKAMDLATENYDFLTEDPVWAEDFAPHGVRVRAGDVMTRQRYAKTLETIAIKGADAFYTGAMAKAMADALQRDNGTMSLQDLEDYRVISRPSPSIDYKGLSLRSCGVPASGCVVLSALKILEGFDDSDVDAQNLKTHRLDEAIRFGYGKRTSFGDPQFVDDLAHLEAEILSDKFAAATRDRISDYHTLNISDYDPDGFESLEDHGTSHIVTADASGMAFSLTTTVNLFFGSRLMVPETGVIMNDQMNDFSIPHVPNVFGYYPSPSNYVSPHKRPLTSISPLIIEHKNGTLHSVLGASGGSRIITTTIQNTIHIVDSEMSIAQALRQPRLHDQLTPNVVIFEEDYDDEIVAFMAERGHIVTRGEAGSSGQGLTIVDGKFDAAGEPRQKDSAGLTA